MVQIWVFHNLFVTFFLVSQLASLTFGFIHSTFSVEIELAYQFHLTTGTTPFLVHPYPLVVVQTYCTKNEDVCDDSISCLSHLIYQQCRFSFLVPSKQVFLQLALYRCTPSRNVRNACSTLFLRKPSPQIRLSIMLNNSAKDVLSLTYINRPNTFTTFAMFVELLVLFSMHNNRVISCNCVCVIRYMFSISLPPLYPNHV